MKPSNIQKKKVRNRVIEDVYKRKGKPYSSEINPYQKGTTNYSRYERGYPKVRKTYWKMEAYEKELIEVYGDFRPTSQSTKSFKTLLLDGIEKLVQFFRVQKISRKIS